MANRTRLKSAGIILLCSAALLILFWHLFLYFLPRFIEADLIPKFAAKAGIGPVVCRIRRIGLLGFDAGPLVIGSRDRPGIRVDAVQVDYTPAGLIGKRIDRIVLSGVDLHTEIEKGELRINGLDLERGNGAGGNSEKTKPSSEPLEWPVRIGSVEIRSALVHLRKEGRAFTIPFAARLIPDPGAPMALRARLETMLLNQMVALSAHLDANARKADLSIAIPSWDLRQLAGLQEVLSEWMPAGHVTLHGDATVQWQPFQLTNATVRLDSGDFQVTREGWRIGPGQDGEGKSSLFQIRLNQIGNQRWRAEADNLMITGTVPLMVDRLSGELSFEGSGATAAMKVSGNLPAFPGDDRIPLSSRRRIPLFIDASGRYDADGRWTFKFSNISGEKAVSPQPIELGGKGVMIRSSMPVLEMSAQGRRFDGEGRFSFWIPKIRLRSDAGEVSIPLISLTGQAAVTRLNDQLQPSLSWSVKANDIKGLLSASSSASAVNLKVPALSAAGQLRGGTADSAATLTGKIRMADAAVSAPGWDAVISPIRAELPFQWPFRKGGGAGKIAVDGIQWGKLHLGTLQMAVNQTPDGIRFQADHQSRILPDATLRFSGGVDLLSPAGPTAKMGMILSRPLSAVDIEPGQWFSGLEGLTVNGALSLDSRFQWRPASFSGSATVAVDQGKIGLDEQKLRVDNVKLRLEMPELPALRSSPNQALSFDRVAFGELTANDGKVAFRIESPDTLFIESAAMRWCEGQIRSQSMRISSKKDEYDFRLYCDRLNLAKVLEQLAVAKSEGNGTVNGYIPVNITHGKVLFDDGFLYSTPGDGGTIRLSGTDALIAGIPAGTRQFFQIDLAREALKDFEYKWAKLRLINEKDTLLMRLQFDGKPAKTLPFEYKKEFGGFVRVAAGSPGSDFQGISLDVNFRVPLNDLLRYKDALKMME